MILRIGPNSTPTLRKVKNFLLCLQLTWQNTVYRIHILYNN